MKPRLALIVTLAALGLLTASLAMLPLVRASSGNALEQVEPERTRTLHAYFTSTDGEGVVTDVDIYATSGPGVAEATIEVSQYRPTCADNGCPEVLLHAFNRVPLSASELVVSEALNSATLRTTRPIRERLTAESDTITIDLTWQAVGQLVSDHHEEGEGFRRAWAAGTIRSGDTNFTPEPAIDAQIEEW